jgi:uncharacterized protein YrrD
MTEPVSWLVIEPGWTVEAGDGKELGTVREVLGDEKADIFDGLAVSHGVLKRARYVPAENVGEITEGRVALTLSSRDFKRLAEYQPQ